MDGQPNYKPLKLKQRCWTGTPASVFFMVLQSGCGYSSKLYARLPSSKLITAIAISNLLLINRYLSRFMSHSVLPLQKIGEIFQGITLSRYADDNGRPERVVSLSDLEYLYIERNPSVVQLRLSDLERYRIKTGDVVISNRGTLLKASVVTDKLEGSLASNNVAVIRPIVEIDPVYLAVLMRSKWLEQQLATLYLQSSTIQLIPISQLRTLKIPLPNLETQNKLAQLFLATERANRITLEILDTRNNLSEFALFQTLEGQQ